MEVIEESVIRVGHPDTAFGRGSMDKVADSLDNAYQDLVTSAMNYMEASEDPKTLQNFKLNWELFKVACDQAEEFVDSVKQRIEYQCQEDEVLRRVAAPGEATATSLPPVTKKEE